MRYLLICIVLSLSGCAVIPENIQIADETRLVSYEQAVTTTESTVTQPARWGGLIAEVENKVDGTFVEVVHFPLNHYGKPRVNGETTGRFKVKMEGFLDPVVFESGRAITFTGTVDQPSSGFVGEQPYLYPTLAGDSFHLWRKETVYDVRSTQFNNFGWWGPGWGPGWGGFWGGRFYRPGWGAFGPWGPAFQNSRVRVIQRAPTANPNSVKASTPSNRPYHGNRPYQSTQRAQ